MRPARLPAQLVASPRAAAAPQVLPGRWGFISQLNEGRATKKRPTEFRVDQARTAAPSLVSLLFCFLS